uniref:Uncharacterized protein n=1 Tax=Rhizophagus irregularis (strain DAOM 181602 / DAOM 197198 / MUCL 43194) TaxID=747089 RepID=U9UV52_RHIID
MKYHGTVEATSILRNTELVILQDAIPVRLSLENGEIKGSFIWEMGNAKDKSFGSFSFQNIENGLSVFDLENEMVFGFRSRYDSSWIPRRFLNGILKNGESTDFWVDKMVYGFSDKMVYGFYGLRVFG